MQRDIEATLADVHIAVNDWAACGTRMRAVIGALENNPPPLPAMKSARHGACSIGWKRGTSSSSATGTTAWSAARSEDQLVPDTRSGLGILSDYQHRRPQPRHPTVLRGDVRARARESELLILTKANSTATVHRGEYLDYVGVKTFDERGNVDGEHRFLGLWTSTAYHRQPARYSRAARES